MRVRSTYIVPIRISAHLGVRKSLRRGDEMNLEALGEAKQPTIETY